MPRSLQPRRSAAFRSVLAVACVLASAAVLGGCSTFGDSAGSSAPAASSGGNSFTNLFKFGSTTAPPVQEMQILDFSFTCPDVDIIEGGAALRQMAGGTIRSQLTIGQTARECRVNGEQVTIKVGLEGRALLGSGGSPGTYSAPIRIVIKDGDKVLASRLVRQSVTIPPNDSQATFTVIEDNMVVPKGDLSILVGFDPNGRGAEPVRKRKRG